MSKKLWIKKSLKKGELYAGLILGKGGQPDHHLVLLPGQANDVSWNDAKAWAEKAGGELPTRREQSLLFANLPEEFEQRYYWSGELNGSEYAWCQDFSHGYQGISTLSTKLRARAVRRLEI